MASALSPNPLKRSREHRKKQIDSQTHEKAEARGTAPNQAQKSAVETINSFTPFYQEIEAKAKQQLAAIRACESYTTEKRSDDSERLYGLVSLLSVSSNSTLLSEGISAAALPPTLDYNRVQDILKLFQLEYFIRLWPVQEIVLSRRKTIYLGVFQFVWNLVGWFSGFFVHKYRHLDIKEDRLEGIQAAMWVYSYARTHSTGFPFATKLRATRRFQATVTKDQVYALYGMIDFNLNSNGDRHDASVSSCDAVPAELKPDYSGSKTSQQVNFDVARFLLMRDQNLLILASMEPHSSEGPNWVPSWNSREGLEHVWLPNTGAENFSACAVDDTQIRCWEGSGFYACAVHGKVICKVMACHPCPDMGAASDNVDDKMWAEVAALVGRLMSWLTERRFTFFTRTWLKEKPRGQENWSEDNQLIREIAMVLIGGRAERGSIATETSWRCINNFADLMLEIHEIL